MKKKISWIFVSCLMVLSLILASCGGGPVEEEEEEEEIVKEEEEEEEEIAKKEEEKTEPEYGGVLNLARGGDINNFDEIYGWHVGAYTMHLTNEELWTGDWTKGPAGTNETDWAIPALDRWDQKAGAIAESWDFSQLAEGIITFKIRKGIHWALNPDSEASRLVGGRELTAEDVAFTINMHITTPRSYIYTAAPELRKTAIATPDKYTLVVKVPPDQVEAALSRFCDFMFIVPSEVVEKYGDMTDWRVSVGTGPFILTDFIPGSSVTLVRNPDYWGTNPIGPGKGDQLPYIDGVKALIIPDASTREAALRTGSIDIQREVMRDTALMIEKMTPDLLEKKYWMEGGWATGMRTDKPELPFDDIRVRRAMMMATDFETIRDDFYGGDAQILTFPIIKAKEYEDAYLGLDDPECPESVKELYVYNPEKAKALLAEAGYPDGFKTSIIINNTNEQVDYYSILKNMWAEVGIDLTLEPLESSIWTSTFRQRGYEEMIHDSTGGVGSLYKCPQFWGTTWTNCSFVDDPYIDEVRAQIMSAISLGDQSKADGIYKELMKYVLDQAWAIPFPNLRRSAFWWPWVKDYHGEFGMGYYNWDTYSKYVWIDQDLKKELTGK